MIGGGGNHSFTNSSKDGISSDGQWVNVTWVPHTTLSQTSHVCFAIRSAHAVFDPLYDSLQCNDEHIHQLEWKVRIGVYGVAGLLLVPVMSHTTAAPVSSRRQKLLQLLSSAPATAASTAASSTRRREATETLAHAKMTMIGSATHDCVWDYLVQMPIRWRDLPRDAYLEFEVLGGSLDSDNNNRNIDQVLYRGTIPFFSQYGKLRTGLQRIRLQTTLLDPNINHGLVPLDGRHNSHQDEDHHCIVDDDSDDEDDNSGESYDPVWKASRILDQLNRLEERVSSRSVAKTTSNPVTGKSTTVVHSNSNYYYNHYNDHDFGQIPAVPWLDAMLKQRAEQVIADAAFESSSMTSAYFPVVPYIQHQQQQQHMSMEGTDITPATLVIELPVFDIPILHEEIFYPLPLDGASGAVAPFDVATYRKQRQQQPHQHSFHPLQLVPFVDYENERDNPFEDKYRTLARDLLRGLVDPALKPNKEQRNWLAQIIDSPSHHPTPEEKDLLWQFRFSLVDNRRALTKFLLAVDWTVESEVVQAAELLEQWRKRSPIEVTDALKLLGKNVAFQTNLVRAYAIDTLASAPDSELRLYLLQLVQALKYETTVENTSISASNSNHIINNNSINIAFEEQPSASGRTPSSTYASTQVSGGASSSTGSIISTPSSPGSLAMFLINRAADNIELANFLYWYLKVELTDPTHGAKYKDIFAAFQTRLSQSIFSSSISSGKIPTLTSEATSKASKTRSMWDVLVEQDEFISGVMDIQLRSRQSRGKKDAKEMELRSLLSKEGYDRKCVGAPVPLPSTPSVFVNGVNPDTAKIFKSALYPALLEFQIEQPKDLKMKLQISNSMNVQHKATATASVARTSKIDSTTSISSSDAVTETPPKFYKVMVKTGDDLRQDQLVIMMIQLMDRLLKRSALDLCLTPYSILATSPNSGLVEFVDGAMPISQVLQRYNNSILQFFQAAAPSLSHVPHEQQQQPSNGPSGINNTTSNIHTSKYGVRSEIMSTYVRSCAGYCVITYLIGVGDRHLDNILLRSTGHFFHIDFGFIFGRDPKPLPPAFRLTREMVDGMGGFDSSEYRQFCSLACQAYNSLRKSAGLILNLLHLMSDARIEDLSTNPVAEIAKVEERFKLHLTDEQAERFFLGLINDCLSAIAPRVMDVFHSFAVARR